MLRTLYSNPDDSTRQESISLPHFFLNCTFHVYKLQEQELSSQVKKEQRSERSERKEEKERYRETEKEERRKKRREKKESEWKLLSWNPF